MPNYRSPFPFLADEHMRLVGIIAFHWEAVDLTLQRAVAEAADHTFDRVGLLTDNLSFRAKQDLLMSYARPFQTEAPALWKEFIEVLEAVKAAYTLRNTYVHAKWRDGGSSALPNRVAVNVRGGKFNKHDKPTPIEELEKAAPVIFDAGAKVTMFFQRFGILKPVPKPESLP